MSRGNWPLILGLALIAIGIAGITAVVLMSASRMVGPGGRQQTAFDSNGERIYYTATSDSGRPITFSGGPHWLRMRGGGCVNCHGPDGRGGTVVPMTNVKAADIRYSTLTVKMHEDEEEIHPPYTDETIKRAITEGLNPVGEPLDSAMPRWRMSERDLNDVMDYLKALDGDGR